MTLHTEALTPQITAIPSFVYEVNPPFIIKKALFLSTIAKNMKIFM